MRGLGRRIAAGLNELWKRTGRVFAHRYHDEVLRSLRRVRNALRYVLHNDAKHGCRHPRDRGRPDPFSSGADFDGWKELPPRSSPAGAASPSCGAAGSSASAG